MRFTTFNLHIFKLFSETKKKTVSHLQLTRYGLPNVNYVLITRLTCILRSGFY